jgi:uncharacterized protein GlcG (DUF336 family)
MKTPIAATLLAIALPAAAATTATESTLATDAAMQAATAALAACRADNQKVAVTVVDHAGRIKVQLRDDGAAPHTMEHSFRKAYTALSYKMPSAEYGKRAGEAKGVAIGPQLLPNITTAAGGVPITVDSKVVGAIGVSGTPSSGGGGEHDGKCAQQGVAKALGQ